ncbi:MAG: (d)CMP kinase [Clostridiales bacterium]|nr:(d)CMP kinase [Clostridiales bacterium]
MDKISVAIDGPGGAGKSTIAKAIARRFGFIYVDTGAIYRTVGLRVRRVGADPSSAEEVTPLLESMKIEMKYDESGSQRMLLDGEDVSNAIRTPEMSMYASAVSALPEVRAFLLEMQRSMAREHSVIMDGRDIGTVVLPDADVKIFLTAAPEERARRRYLELQARGTECSYEQVLEEMNIRDKNDSERAAAPLKRAEDAIAVDTTDMSLEQSEDAVAEIIEKRIRV